MISADEYSGLLAQAADHVATGRQHVVNNELDKAYKEYISAAIIYDNVKKSGVSGVKIDNKFFGEALYYRARSNYDLLITEGKWSDENWFEGLLSTVAEDLDEAYQLNPDSKLLYCQLSYLVIAAYTKLESEKGAHYIGTRNTARRQKKQACYKNIIALPCEIYTFKAIKLMLELYIDMCVNSGNCPTDYAPYLELGLQVSNDALRKLQEIETTCDNELIYEIYSLSMKITQYRGDYDKANTFILSYTAKMLQTGQLSIKDIRSFGDKQDALFLQKLDSFFKAGPGYELLVKVIEQLSIDEAIHLLNLLLALQPVSSWDSFKEKTKANLMYYASMSFQQSLNKLIFVSVTPHKLFITLAGESCDKATYGERTQSLAKKLAELEAEKLKESPGYISQKNRITNYFFKSGKPNFEAIKDFVFQNSGNDTQRYRH
jgi:hypothetical protein